MAFVSDTFTDTNGVALASHVGETGATWTKHPNFTGGASDIQANRTRCTTATALSYASGTPAGADYDVEGVVVFLTVSGARGICGRMDTTNTTYYIAQYSQSAGAWQLIRVVTASATTLGSWTHTPTTGASETVKLEMRGDQLSIYVDGTLRIGPITDANITAKGKAGVRASNNAGTTTGQHLTSLTATEAPVGLVHFRQSGVWIEKPLKVRAAGSFAAKPMRAFSPPQSSWNGDYDTGDASQYGNAQITDALSVVMQQVKRRKGSGYAARYQIDPGENAGIPPSNRDRAELIATAGQNDGFEGRECWYGWSSYFPSNSPAGEYLNTDTASGSTNIFTQWHEGAPTWSLPPVRFSLKAGTNPTPPHVIRLAVAGGGTFPNPAHTTTYDLGDELYNQWMDFVLHIKWSADPLVGFVACWYGAANTLVEASPTVAETAMSTLYPDMTTYMKQGFYKSTTPGLTTVVYHDETKRGNSFTDVCPTGTPS